MIEIQATLDFLDIMLIIELLFAVRPCDDCTRTKPLVDHGGHILGATVGRTFETTLTDAGPCGSVHGTQRATLGVFRTLTWRICTVNGDFFYCGSVCKNHEKQLH